MLWELRLGKSWRVVFGGRLCSGDWRYRLMDPLLEPHVQHAGVLLIL